MKLISELKKEDLDDKKVLLRVDFNVSVDQGGKMEDFKIKSHLETVNYLLENGAFVVMLSHIDPPLTSFDSIVGQISAVLGHEINLISLPDFLTTSRSTINAITSKVESPFATHLILVDNIRQDPREIQNDEGFAQELAKAIPNNSEKLFGHPTPEGFRGFDLYINDAFGVMHRNHASVAGVAKFLPAYAGFLVKKETTALQEVIDAPVEGKVLVMGGAKISTKLPVIQNFLTKAEKILVGGALANDFFKARGINVGVSLIDETPVPELDPNIVILPQDIVISQLQMQNGKTEELAFSSDRTTVQAVNIESRASILNDVKQGELIGDIGPQSAEIFAEIIERARVVIWNGPMGLSEITSFARGTEIIAHAVADSARSIIGGGDTITTVHKLGLLDKMSFVSTGGGAMLAFLAGEKLPGLEALGYYK